MLLVQSMRDGSQAEAVMRIALEDASNDRRTLRHDLEPVALLYRMPVRVLADDDRVRPIAEATPSARRTDGFAMTGRRITAAHGA